MLKALDFEILRDVMASGIIRIPSLTRKPVRVGTLINEEEFMPVPHPQQDRVL